MEMMNLKLSFTRKLNHQGLSPIHLALEKGHTELVLRLMEMHKELDRIKGKNGETPLHYISKFGIHNDLLDKFLEVCSDCILDVTTQNHTALHIAVENRRLDVLQVLIKMLRKKDYCEEVVIRKDENDKTALHLAACDNQPQMLKLLLNCKADKHVTNHASLTALDVAQQHNYRESITTLCGCFIPVVSNFKPKLKKQIVSYATKASSLIFHDIDNISDDERNALQVILGQHVLLALLKPFPYNFRTTGATGVSYSVLSPIDIFHHPKLFSTNNSLSPFNNCSPFNGVNVFRISNVES